MAAQARFWAAIPAAGVGARMGSGVPKQYLTVRGRCILAHVLDRFCDHPAIVGVVVAIAEHDARWPVLGYATHAKVQTAPGGAERCQSVLNSLRRLLDRARPDDWVLVHDAARPCVRRGDIDRLIETAGNHAVGGILALPVRDTMKRADGHDTVAATVEREGLWHALTPQMFRVGPLEHALAAAIAQGRSVTDEAQAMEMQGLRPLLVPGHADNIKITHDDDLALAELFLSLQENQQ